MSKIIALFSVTTFLFLTLSAQDQEGWNWPEDPDLKSKALENEAFYKLQIAQSKWEESMKPLNWLYNNTPDLNSSIYIKGVEVLSEIIEKEKDATRKNALQDSALWMYDQRIKYFDDDASVLDRKAYQAFRFYYKTPFKYELLESLYREAYEANGPDISPFNLSNFMFLAKSYHTVKKSEMPAEEVLDIHSLISETIEQKMATGQNLERLKKEQDKTDAFLSSIPGILTCEFIEEQLVPKFEENPEDLNTAKKIFSYSLKAKCIDKPYWLRASEKVYAEKPNFKLANTLGNRYSSNKDYKKALEFQIKAAELASTNEEKYDALMGQATAYSKFGNKSKARSLAYEALSVQPGRKEAFNLIGNLYYSSYEECKQNKSQVEDRAVFLAAYKMYEKAGNSSQMKACKEQFPSIEDIFNGGYEEGNSLTVSCWINESVTIQRR